MAFGKHCIRPNDGMIDRPVREAVRTIDAIESEDNYFFERHPEYCNLIYKEARNVFSNRFSAAALK